MGAAGTPDTASLLLVGYGNPIPETSDAPPVDGGAVTFQRYAGLPAPNPAQIFPHITLPQNYGFGRNFDSQDVRVTKVIRVGEHLEWQVFTEIFNLLNYANLTGYDGQSNEINSPNDVAESSKRVRAISS